jgi:cytidylate kinase
MSAIPVITIDGPSGSGKGTIAQKIAQQLDWHLLDSGALYRVLAYQALAKNIALDDADALAATALQLPLMFVGREPQLPAIMLDQQDVTAAIRTEAIGKAASQIAALPQVRQALLDRQKSFRQFPGLVADGRDMGTVIFPDAIVKVFLTASPAARAQRRFLQLKAAGYDGSLAQLEQEIADRDQQDQQRQHAPLKAADDAVMVDSSDLSITQVLDRVMELIVKANVPRAPQC